MRMRAGLLAISWAAACGVLATASAQKDRTPPADESAPVASWAQVEGPIEGRLEGDGAENRVFFVQPGSQSMEEMRARLAEPVQRKIVRAEQCASLEQSYADAEGELKIDSTTREALIALLADQYLESLDAMFGKQAQAWPSMHDMAERENRKLEQLREVLGEDGLARYQEYTATVHERGQVRQVDAYLGAADKLSPEQKTRLIRLFKERNQLGLPPPAPSRMSKLLRSPDPRSATFQQDLQRESQRATIEANEQILWLREKANRTMIERAAAFLRPAQSAALAKVSEAEVARQRQWIEQARASAGLDASIPGEGEDGGASLPKTASGEVTLDLVVRVDGGEPVHVTHTGPSGETLRFKASEDLSAEAEWTLYESGWIDVRLSYFEEGPDGLRRLSGGSGFGTVGGFSSDIGNRNSSSTIVTGRKAYAIELSASAVAR